MTDIRRRTFVQGVALGALAFTVGDATTMLTPSEARAQNVPFRMLKAHDAETLEALGDTLVPGARAAGIAHFIDQQISVPPGEALLNARIMNVKPPFANLYRGIVNAVDGASQKAYGAPFARLNSDDQNAFVGQMRQGKVAGWQGLPGPFVYAVMRSDAVDVVFCTMEGYEALGVPYMPHIAPDRRW
jgi:hypothetical protein